MLRLADSFLRSEEADGHPKGTFVRESSLCMELSANVFCVCLGEQRPTAVGMEIRDLSLKDPQVRTFGTIDVKVWALTFLPLLLLFRNSKLG
jgi:hypothetical protein